MGIAACEQLQCFPLLHPDNRLRSINYPIQVATAPLPELDQESCLGHSSNPFLKGQLRENRLRADCESKRRQTFQSNAETQI